MCQTETFIFIQIFITNPLCSVTRFVYWVLNLMVEACVAHTV